MRAPPTTTTTPPLVEVEETTLQGRAQYRKTPEGRQGKYRQHQTERQEVGNRAAILRIATFNYVAPGMSQPIFKEESIREDTYHAATPDEVDRLEHLMGDHFDIQQIRLSPWGRVISDITYWPKRAFGESRRRTQQLVSYGRRLCENISRWMAKQSLAAFLHNARAPTEEYDIASLKVAPATRETEKLRRRQGRYRKQRNNALGGIRQQNPSG